MRKVLVFVSLFALSLFAVQAQNEVDAFRFSQNNYAGTARFMGAGSSFSAIGGDFTSLAINPAGIGVFKRSEISFTPLVLNVLNTGCAYGNDYATSNLLRYTLTSFGMVYAWNLSDEHTRWKTMQLGFGYNRTNDFNNSLFMVGRSHSTSMVDDFISSANGTFYGNLTHDGKIAWDSWLIDTISGEMAKYYSPITGHDLKQSKYAITTGGVDELDFSWGGNYDDKLFLGLTVGVPFLDYTMRSEYEEADDNDEIYSFDNYTVTDRLESTGIGINAKVGVIYQPVSFMRIGVAVHTPTYYNNIKETFNRNIYVTNSLDPNSDESYENTSRYKLVTPFRVIGSVGFLIAKRAFINAEYEFADYSTARLYSSDLAVFRYPFIIENDNIQNNYKGAHSLRVGGELTVTHFFLVRLGYGYTSSPFVTQETNGDTHSVSCGIGFRGRFFFTDLAYIWRYNGTDYKLYSTADNASITCKTNRFAWTMGWKF